MRHGPKAEIRDITTQSLISEEGKKKVREVGKKREVQRHGIKAYTSPVERAIETAELILEEQEKKGAKIFKTRKRTELGMWSSSKKFTQRFAEMIKENLPPNFEELEGDAKQEALDKTEDKILDWWLGFKDQRPDETTPPPREIAAGVAKLVDRYINMADRLYSGSEIELLNTSHKGIPESLLKEVLLRKVKGENNEEKIIRGFESLQDIGGSMRPSESWSLIIKTDDGGNKTIKILLRGQEYDLDTDRLNELVELWDISKNQTPSA